MCMSAECLILSSMCISRVRTSQAPKHKTHIYMKIRMSEESKMNLRTMKQKTQHHTMTESVRKKNLPYNECEQNMSNTRATTMTTAKQSKTRDNRKPNTILMRNYANEYSCRKCAGAVSLAPIQSAI